MLSDFIGTNLLITSMIIRLAQPLRRLLSTRILAHLDTESSVPSHEKQHRLTSSWNLLAFSSAASSSAKRFFFDASRFPTSVSGVGPGIPSIACSTCVERTTFSHVLRKNINVNIGRLQRQRWKAVWVRFVRRIRQPSSKIWECQLIFKLLK